MTSKLVVNTIEADTGISSVSFASSISMSSTSKFFFGAAGIDIGADTNINRPASGVLGFNINNSEKVRITSDGKIGINTVSPTYGMHLHGTTASSNAYYYAEQSTAGASAGFRLKTTGSHFSIYGATSGSALGIYDYNASAERVTITSGGNILVGTTVDSNNKVTLYGNNASVVMQNAATNTGSSNGFYLGNGNGTLCYVWNYENDAIQFATNNTERLRITNNGQLNTYTTGTISADFNTSNGAGSYLQFDTGASGANIGYIGAGSQLVTGSATNDLGFRSAQHMVFSTGGSVERLRINSNGQIYCTTTTTIALDLNTTNSGGAYIQLDTGVSGANIGYIGAGSQLVTGSATNDLGFRSVQNLVFSTGGSTERLRIDSSGIITKPYQPAFLAVNTASYAGNATISAGSHFDFFKATKFNRGNHFDTTNGYFVAPVTGIYYMNAQISVRSSATGVQIGYTVNGTVYHGGTDSLVFEANVNGISAMHPNGALLMSLSAGDIVRLYNRSASFTCGRHHSWWQGYLIG